MKQTINQYNFTEAFRKIRPNNFSYEGLKALYDYLEGYEEDTGEELELDVIAFCCDFTEYKNLKEFQSDHSDEYKTIDDIEDATTVIRIDNESFITQSF